MPVSAFKDYYRILGVRQTASPAEIKRAFRKLARSCHPDLNPSNHAAARFQEIKEAYDILNHPDRRKQHDLSIQAHSSSLLVDHKTKDRDDLSHRPVPNQLELRQAFSQVLAELETFLRQQEQFLPLKIIFLAWVVVGIPTLALSIWQLFLNPSREMEVRDHLEQPIPAAGTDIVETKANSLPRIAQFYSPKSSYKQKETEQPATNLPSRPTVTSDPPEEVVVLNWEITNPDHVKELRVIDWGLDANTNNPVRRYIFQGGKIPRALTPFCTQKETLVCLNVPTHPRQAGFYTLQLVVIAKPEPRLLTPTKITESIDIETPLDESTDSNLPTPKLEEGSDRPPPRHRYRSLNTNRDQTGRDTGAPLNPPRIVPPSASP